LCRKMMNEKPKWFWNRLFKWRDNWERHTRGRR
jgi:hypothetical protein